MNKLDCVCTHARTHARPHARTHARPPARTPARTHAHTHTHTHTHTHEGTCLPEYAALVVNNYHAQRHVLWIILPYWCTLALTWLWINCLYVGVRNFLFAPKKYKEILWSWYTLNNTVHMCSIDILDWLRDFYLNTTFYNCQCNGTNISAISTWSLKHRVHLTKTNSQTCSYLRCLWTSL